MLGCPQQRQLALVEPQSQGAPPVSRLPLAPPLVVVHFWRRVPDQRCSMANTTPPIPAKTVPIARLNRKTSSIDAAGPAGGASEVEAATTIAQSSEANTTGR